MSAEATVVRNYIDWMLSLPWSKRTKDRLDLNMAEEILNEDHYGLEQVKERILEFLAVRQLTKNSKGPILCLVGPPGWARPPWPNLWARLSTATSPAFPGRRAG